VGGVESNWVHSAVRSLNRPTVPAPGDYDGEIGGMMIGRGNRSTQRKPDPVPLCPPQIPHDLLGREPGPIFYLFIVIIWFVTLLALRPLLAYCASLG
jgi:hypothetical protein